MPVGAWASGYLLPKEKHFYAVQWLPPDSIVAEGFLAVLQPSGSAADSDLAVSQYGPDVTTFVSQASSSNGPGMTDSIGISLSAMPLAAVLAARRTPPTIYIEISGFVAGNYLLTTSFIATSPSSSQTSSDTATASSTSTSSPTPSSTGSADAEGVAMDFATRSPSPSRWRSASPTQTRSWGTTRRDIVVSGASVGSSTNLIDSFGPEESQHVFSFQPPATGVWTFILVRTSLTGDLRLCAGLDSSGSSSTFTPWCARPGTSFGAPQQIDINVGTDDAARTARRRLERHLQVDATIQTAAPLLIRITNAQVEQEARYRLSVKLLLAAASVNFVLKISATSTTGSSTTGSSTTSSSTTSSSNTAVVIGSVVGTLVLAICCGICIGCRVGCGFVMFWRAFRQKEAPRQPAPDAHYAA